MKKSSLYLIVTLFILIILLIILIYPKNFVRVGSTTSLENSGFLSYVNDYIMKKYHKKLHIIAMGTGQILKIAKNGDVDILFVHAPNLEEKFMKGGFGIKRKTIMKNYFVIVGPKDDPAHIKDVKDVFTAFKKIMESNAIFVSRGDNSGTYNKEMFIWNKMGVKPAWKNYKKSGQGMGNTLKMTDEFQGYTLTDIATFLKLKKTLSLEILFQKDDNLKNLYSVILVKNPKLKKNAEWFYNFAVSAEFVSFFTNYRINGQRVFFKLDE